VCVRVGVCAQDDASVHRAKIVNEYWKDSEFSHLPSWPAQSPDLNPLENLWGIMSQKLANTAFEDTEALRRGVCAAWDALEQQTIDHLVSSFPSRCRAVLEAKGSHTRY
jgi:hypothetical protein